MRRNFENGRLSKRRRGGGIEAEGDTTTWSLSLMLRWWAPDNLQSAYGLLISTVTHDMHEQIETIAGECSNCMKIGASLFLLAFLPPTL